MQRPATPDAAFDVVAYAIAAVQLFAVGVWFWDVSAAPSSRLLYDPVGAGYYALGLVLVVVACIGLAVLWRRLRSAYIGSAEWRRSATCMAVTSLLLVLQLGSMVLLEFALSGPMIP